MNIKKLIKKIIGQVNNDSLIELKKEIELMRKENLSKNEEIKHLINSSFVFSDKSLKKSFDDIHNHINLVVRISNNLTKITPRKRQNKIKIAFVINNIDSWISICDIVSMSSNSDKFDVIILTANKKFPGEKKYSGEDKVHKFLEEKNIPHIRLNMTDSWAALDIIRALNPDVLFRQSQWDDDYDMGLRSDVLTFTRLAYVSYELANQTENVHCDDDVIDNATDSHWHRRCWRVYCANELVKKQAYEKGRMEGRQFVVTGHPKVEYILRAKPHWPFEENDKKRKKVVWSAHHTITSNWSSFGMFHIIWRNMLDWAKSDTNIEFVFSPHPALLTVLESDDIPISKEDVKLFFREWNQLENTYIFWGGDYSGIMAAADVLLSDSLSMPMEYQLRNKPIVFLDREDRIKFNEIGKIIEQGFHKAADFDTAKSMVINFLNGKHDDLFEKQKENMRILFGERNCAERILEDIYENINKEFI